PGHPHPHRRGRPRVGRNGRCPCRADCRANGPEAAALRGSGDRRAPTQSRGDGPRGVARPGRRARLRPSAAAPARHGAVALTEHGATKWADVDASAIAHNTSLVNKLVGDRTAGMAVVKADGYGHGAVPAARAALQGGATWLAVSSVPEGIELRKAGILEPILNLGYTPPSVCSAATSARLALTDYDREGLALLK